MYHATLSVHTGKKKGSGSGKKKKAGPAMTEEERAAAAAAAAAAQKEQNLLQVHSITAATACDTLVPAPCSSHACVVKIKDDGISSIHAVEHSAGVVHGYTGA